MVIKRNQNSIFYRNIARRNRNQLVTKLKFLFPIETKLGKESLRRNEVKVFEFPFSVESIAGENSVDDYYARKECS